MTALLELKQKIKSFYSEHDVMLLSISKFLLAFVLFQGINSSMGMMGKINNIFIVLILSLICTVMPMNAMAVIGCFMIVAHCYAVGIEVAGFAAILLLLMMILFLRFTAKDNATLVFTPVAFTFHMPAAVPVLGGLLRAPSCSVPAGCGVLLYYFMKVVKEKSSVLQGKETKLVQKLQILLDGLMKNQEMWLTILTFVVVVMIVYIISRCSFDYSWRIANATGAVSYIVIMVLGGMFLNINIKMGSVVISAILAVVLGLITEFAVLGVDYSRSEHTQFEDDEYVYYVKAVPKSIVAKKEKSIKTISLDEDKKEVKGTEQVSPVEKTLEENFDFEKQLEESLKDL